MKVTCQKSYVLTVNNPPPPYNLEASGFWFVDPAKVDNGFFTGFHADHLISPQSDDHFNFVGRSFTIRFWALSTGQDGWFLSNFSGAVGWILIQSGHFSVFPNKKYAFGFSPVTDDLLFALTDLPDSVWHRVICTYNHATNVISIRINNDAAVSATPHDPLVSNTDYLQLNLGEAGGGIDELGFWRDYVWTAADATFDWNSGAGSTYARSKVIGSGPYAYYRLEELLTVGFTKYAKGEI